MPKAGGEAQALFAGLGCVLLAHPQHSRDCGAVWGQSVLLPVCLQVPAWVPRGGMVQTSLSCVVWRGPHGNLINAFHTKRPTVRLQSATCKRAGANVSLSLPLFICFLLTECFALLLCV